MPFADANGITLCYETFGRPADPCLVLVMGLGEQMTAWPRVFCRMLADSGYFVVRFDNRDIGLSHKCEDAGMPDLGRAWQRILRELNWFFCRNGATEWIIPGSGQPWLRIYLIFTGPMPYD